MKFINNNFAVIGQIQPSDIIELKKHNFSVIVNNRPDNEATNQPLSKEIEEIAKQHQIHYYHIPVSGMSSEHINALKTVLAKHQNEKILGFCASGNRASMLYMMANPK